MSCRHGNDKPSSKLPPPPLRLVESEYDMYRENYRLFDSALCLMPPEHRLRRFCLLILTARMSRPVKTRPSAQLAWRHIQTAKNWITFKLW